MRPIALDQSPEVADSKDLKKKRRSRKPKQTSSVSDQQLMPQQGLQAQQIFQSDSRGRIFSGSCSEPIACEESMDGSDVRSDFHLSRQKECRAQRKYFTSYWSPEAVNGALEKGDVFKALFHVNAHNRLEAYCKIDGVPADILISGITAQNRAVINSFLG